MMEIFLGISALIISIAVLVAVVRFFSCKHDWLSHSKDMFQRRYSYAETGIIVKEILICKKCGKMKHIEY